MDMRHTGEAVSLLEVAAVIQDMFPDHATGLALCPAVDPNAGGKSAAGSKQEHVNFLLSLEKQHSSE